MSKEVRISLQTIFEVQADLCRCMSNPARIMILHHLRSSPKRVTEIAVSTGLPQGTVSRHLAILRTHGIVSNHREGQEVIYEIANPKIVSICDLMREVLEEYAVQRSKIMGEFEDKFIR